jgi:hypothetical protein
VTGTPTRSLSYIWLGSKYNCPERERGKNHLTFFDLAMEIFSVPSVNCFSGCNKGLPSYKGKGNRCYLLIGQSRILKRMWAQSIALATFGKSILPQRPLSVM